MHFGTVAIVGRSNVGKSTFLNTVLGENLAIVSGLPQTTRDALLGVAQTPEAQIGFLDTPGLHRPKTELGRRMNAQALEAARSADVVLFMSDVTALSRGKPGVPPDDRPIIASLPQKGTRILALNKVDLVRDKGKLLPLIESYNALCSFASVIPVSVAKADGVDRVLGEITAHLPEGPAGYDADMLTDKPTSFFVREYIREQILQQAGREVPHAVAISIDQIEDTGKLFLVKATIHVEKVGQRKILIGAGGSKIREIGIRARERIEALTGRKVHLSTFVRVTPRWKDTARKLSEFGYEGHGSREELARFEAPLPTDRDGKS
jgi:GTP-binding protein Era